MAEQVPLQASQDKVTEEEIDAKFGPDYGLLPYDDDDEEEEHIDCDKVAKELGDERFIRAAVFIEDALHGRNTNHLTSRRALKLSLAVFETPNDHPSWNRYAALWNIVEYLCLFLYSVEVLGRRIYQGRIFFWRERWNKAKIFVIFIMVVDETLWLSAATPIRYTRIFRPFFLAEKKRVRIVVSAILRTLPRIMDVVFLGSFFVVILGVIGYLMFLDTAQHEIFNTLPQTYVHLIVLITTANYPDVMLPAYRTSGYYALYFIFFLIVTLYILMNLIMAVIYTHYKNQQQLEVVQALKMEQDGLKAAFNELDNDRSSTINFEVWKDLFRALRPKFPREKVYIMYYLVDYDNSKELDLKEFMRVVRVLKLRIRKTDWSQRAAMRKARSCQVASPRNTFITIFHGTREVLKYWTNSNLFDFFVDSLILCSGVLSYTEASLEDENEAQWVNSTQFIFSLLFVTEQALRIFAHGFRKYWRSSWSQFDFIIVTASFVAENISAELGTSTGILRVILLIRVFRLFRLINRIRRFKVIVGTVFQLIPALWVFLQLLMCMYYFFAILGMEFFEHKTERGNPALIGTDYDDLDYYVNNFNSFPSALVTLFELMIVNNWMVTMDGYAATCGTISRAYFIIWWMLSVVVIINLIIAFVLEAYFLQWESNAQRKELEKRMRWELGRAEARGHREGTLDGPLDLEILEHVMTDPEMGASGLRWQAEQRQHISDLMRTMYEGDLQEEIVEKQEVEVDEEAQDIGDIRKMLGLEESVEPLQPLPRHAAVFNTISSLKDSAGGLRFRSMSRSVVADINKFGTVMQIQ